LILTYLSPSTGEVGGYMGLLIGASIITLVELIDLVIYNLIVTHRAKKKEERQEKGHTTQA
jgi:uncharacterized membrane protein